METNRSTLTQAIQEYLQTTRKSKNGTPRLFKFDTDPEDAAFGLMCGYIDYVNSRGRKFLDEDFVKTMAMKIGGALTADHSPVFLVILGSVGNGKTTMLHALKWFVKYARDNNLVQCDGTYFRYLTDVFMPIYTSREIVTMWKEDPKRFNKLLRQPLLAIDDLGAEPTRNKLYGNEEQPIVTLLEERYNHQLFTAITSNLDPKEVTTCYGARVADRLNESSLVITYRNRESYRRKR